MVIGVLVILLALAFPMMRSVGERGRQTTCLNQLRELYATMMHYAVDHQQTLPKAYNSIPHWSNWWDGPLQRYAPSGRDAFYQACVCPANRKPDVVPATGLKGYPYVVNYNLIRPTAANDPHAHPATRLSAISKPSGTILLIDSKNNQDWYIGFYNMTLPDGWGRVAAPHLNTANILWADGHVSSTPLTSITPQQLKLSQ